MPDLAQILIAQVRGRLEVTVLPDAGILTGRDRGPGLVVSNGVITLALVRAAIPTDLRHLARHLREQRRQQRGIADLRHGSPRTEDLVGCFIHTQMPLSPRPPFTPALFFPDNWIYIHSPEVRMGRIQNYKNWSPEMVPDPSRTSLGLEYFLWDTDDEWTWSDERLIERGIREGGQIGLIQPRDVEDSTVVRMKKAYPVYDQRYVQHVATIRRYLERFQNLQTVGRNGLHRYNNQDHSMLTGIYAARNIVGEVCDVWSVNTEETYHEEGRAVSATAGDRLVP